MAIIEVNRSPPDRAARWRCSQLSRSRDNLTGSSESNSCAARREAKESRLPRSPPQITASSKPTPSSFFRRPTSTEFHAASQSAEVAAMGVLSIQLYS